MSAAARTRLLIVCLLSACSGDSTGGVTNDVATEVVFVPDVVQDSTNAPFETFTQPETVTETIEEVTPDVVEPICDGLPKPFFCPCDSNIQCESGFCIPAGEDEVANRCTRACIDACPEGWECRGIAGLPDPIFICQPPIDTLCTPCNVNANCQAVGAQCLTYPDGNFCGRDCQGKVDACPEGYECGEIKNGLGQIVAEQCQPVGGSCQCDGDTDYTSDPENCGFCTNACDYPGADGGCSDSQCHMGDCLPGFVNLDLEESTGCEYACTFAADDDWPDALCTGSDCDQNCDGIDGAWNRAIFVSAAAPQGGTGGPFDPARTIEQGISLAKLNAKDHVYIAAGTYNEQVNLADGISLFGGYSNDGKWTRNLALYTTTITSSSGTSSVRVIVADEILTLRTVVDGLRIDAGTNGNPSGSSYGLWIHNSGRNLELVRLDVIGGNGGSAQPGTFGFQGNPGGDPSPGSTATDWDCGTDGCGEVNAYGRGGPGGPNACGSGGDAGGGQGADARECDTGGNDGSGSPGGAGGGSSGNTGGSGSSGGSGRNGDAGTGAGAVGSDGFWRGAAGHPGDTGNNGVGGGGGGSGSTVDKDCGFFWSGYYPGGGGGGGGGGGCGGSPGGGGGAGGGSFGVFIVDASPTITQCALGHRSGGNGGNGGLGGSGGPGKQGGAGGGGYDGGSGGGNGGNGGSGGQGGHGGGGAGGIAYGLYVVGTSDPACAEVTYAPLGSGGAGGIGGVGGDGTGNKGADGLFDDRNVITASCP